MPDAKASKRDKLLEQQRQLAAKLAALDAREKEAERKNDTRRKILIGGAIIAAIKRGTFSDEQLTVILNRELVADRDRALFDLPARAGVDGAKVEPERPSAPAPAPSPSPAARPAPVTPPTATAAMDRTYRHNPTPRKEDLI